MSRRPTTGSPRESSADARTVEALVTHNRDAIIETDAAGRILRYNPMAARLFEYRLGEALGQHVVDLVVPEPVRRRCRRLLDRYFGGDARVGVPSLLRLPLCRADGSTFAGHVEVIRPGRAPRVLLMIRADDAGTHSPSRHPDAGRREEFLAAAAHELRTPVTSLRLELQGVERQLCKMHGPETHLPRLHRAIERARTQQERLQDLIEMLLDLSRILHGQLELDLVELDLAQLVTEVVDELRARAEHASCELRVDVVPAIGLWDRRRLAAVAAALLDNAIKYGAGAPVEVRVRCTDEHVQLVVSDCGVGIDDAARRRLFEPFTRTAPAPAQPGLGVGLYLAHQVVEAHGGTIAVDSAPGAGATFTVELPQCSDTLDDHSSRSGGSPRGRTR